MKLPWLVAAGSGIQLACWVGSAASHPLGYGSLELQLRADALEGELVLDAPVEPEATTPDERRVSLEARLRTGFSLAADGQPVPLALRVLSIGTGASAVDVVRLRAQTAFVPARLRLLADPTVGDLALTIRGDSLRKPLHAMVRSGVALTLELHPPDAGATLAARPVSSRAGKLADAPPPGAEPGALAGPASSDDGALWWGAAVFGVVAVLVGCRRLFIP